MDHMIEVAVPVVAVALYLVYAAFTIRDALKDLKDTRK